MGTDMFFLRFMAVILFSCHVAANYGIRQSFPENDTYCCHCPSLRLTCNFPLGVSVVWWSIPDRGITNIPAMYPNHMVDNSRMNDGTSVLHVTEASSLETRYGCLVFFPNGSSIDYADRYHPEQRNWTMPNVTFAPSDFSSYLIKWGDPFPYPECFNLSITVDGSLVFVSNYSSMMNYSLNLSDSGRLNEVCWNATDGTQQSLENCTKIVSGFKLNVTLARLDNGHHNISWNNPFPGMFTFVVYLDSRQVFETANASYTTTDSCNGHVCVVALNKQGYSRRECDRLKGCTTCLVIKILIPCIILVLLVLMAVLVICTCYCCHRFKKGKPGKNMCVQEESGMQHAKVHPSALTKPATRA